MTDDKCKLSKQKVLPPSKLLMQATELCDEYEELAALHHFFYQAVEHFLSDQRLSYKTGLSLFPTWLREREANALERLHRLQQGLSASK